MDSSSAREKLRLEAACANRGHLGGRQRPTARGLGGRQLGSRQPGRTPQKDACARRRAAQAAARPAAEAGPRCRRLARGGGRARQAQQLAGWRPAQPVRHHVSRPTLGGSIEGLHGAEVDGATRVTRRARAHAQSRPRRGDLPAGPQLPPSAAPPAAARPARPGALAAPPPRGRPVLASLAAPPACAGPAGRLRGPPAGPARFALQREADQSTAV